MKAKLLVISSVELEDVNILSALSLKNLANQDVLSSKLKN